MLSPHLSVFAPFWAAPILATPATSTTPSARYAMRWKKENSTQPHGQLSSDYFCHIHEQINCNFARHSLLDVMLFEAPLFEMTLFKMTPWKVSYTPLLGLNWKRTQLWFHFRCFLSRTNWRCYWRTRQSPFSWWIYAPNRRITVDTFRARCTFRRRC